MVSRAAAFRNALAAALLFTLAAILAAGGAAAQSSSSELRIAGTVCDGNGRPVADASVRVEQTGKPDVVTQSDANGVFTLTLPTAGPYTIAADKTGSHSLRAAVPAAPAAAHEHMVLILDQKPGGSGSQMEFADQPNFTVAGVTDWTAAGGHGSDASLRTSEALTRETITLKPHGGADSVPAASGNHAELVRTREHVRQQLAQEETAELDRELGELDEKLGDSLAAVHELERAARLDASEENYFAWGSELLLHRAVWQAAQVFADGAKSYPQSARMLVALGTALFASARYDEAAQRLCEASDLEPAKIEPYLFMGEVEMAAPTPLPCVEEKLARFAELQPGNALASYYYAMAISRRQQLPPNAEEMKQVEALLNRAVALDAKCAGAYLQLGQIAFSRRDYEQAIGYYTRAITADPQSGEAHYRLGVAYDRIGAADKAKQEFAMHDAIEKSQAEAVERQRREVKQFLVVLQGQPAPPPAH